MGVVSSWAGLQVPATFLGRGCVPDRRGFAACAAEVATRCWSCIHLGAAGSDHHYRYGAWCMVSSWGRPHASPCLYATVARSGRVWRLGFPWTAPVLCLRARALFLFSRPHVPACRDLAVTWWYWWSVQPCIELHVGMCTPSLMFVGGRCWKQPHMCSMCTRVQQLRLCEV